MMKNKYNVFSRGYMSKIPHRAFAVEYSAVVNALITDVIVVSPFSKDKVINIKAIWDTGATHSVITPNVFTQLGLSAIDQTVVNGVNSRKMAPITLVGIGLPNKLLIPNHRVTVCDIAGGDMLIGMDIIAQGDFSICTGDKKTLFSFAIPPFENKVNLVDKADKINYRNRKYFTKP